ncbi:MAG: hypothetical protein KAJ98_10180 [Spirochaetaceae bacterium]|nr:hypothetical protein [Spirochaetaceae bacterium]
MKPHRIVLSALVFLLMAVTVSAGDKPLELSSAYPTDASITLTFSKNIVNFAVAEENTRCFHLESAFGDTVGVEILMADDQLEPELKRIVNVLPAEPLAAGTEYVLIISGTLRSKSGQTLGEDVFIRFIIE